MNNPMAWLADRIAETVGNEGARVRAELSAGLAKTNNALRLDGARPIPVDGRALALAWGGRGRLLGWSLRNSGATTVTINLRDGRDTSGDLIGTEMLGTNSAWQRNSVWLGPTGISFGEALFLEVTGGTVAGTVYIGAVDA